MAKNAHFQDFPLRPRSKGHPIHRWLYGELRDAIRSGRLKPGARFPSTRSLATQQAIARSTVVTVFEQLQAEGYLAGRTGSGTVVASALPDHFFSKASPPAAAGSPRTTRPSPAMLPSPPALPRPAAFAICTPGLETFPIGKWTQLVARRLRLGRTTLLGQDDPRGYRPLREAVADYLRATRSVHCDSEQVVIVSGTHQALDFVARLTLTPGDRVWMENPGYPGAVKVLRQAQANLVPVPVDRAGLVVEAGVKLEPRPKLAFVTPAHQFPLGTTLSLDRRLALLAAAERGNFWIFEDDYDGEYRYDVRPIGALQGHDHGHRVTYAGSFNKLLFPALRLGFMVLPPALVDPFLALRDTVDRCLPALEQAVLADFIHEGYFERHLRRSRAVYLGRRDILMDALTQRLAGIFDAQKTETGFHLAGWLPAELPDREVQARAATNGVAVMPLSGFHLGRGARNGLLLGFAAVGDRAIRTGVEALARTLSVPAASRPSASGKHLRH